jgi:hypothetical protein
MSARTSNVVQLFPPPSPAERREIIVDEGAKEALALVDGEPTLGPLAREIFPIEEEQNNMQGGPDGNLERWDELARRCNALEKEIITCRAETIGGLAWRLHQLLTIVDNEDLSPWAEGMLRAAIEEANALARMSSAPGAPGSGARA